MVPFTPDSPPSLTGKPVLLLEGVADSIVPRENASRLAALFQDAGANVQLHWTPAGHGMTAEDVSTAKTWFRQFYAS